MEVQNSAASAASAPGASSHVLLAAALVVNKRNLPVILQNDVPPLRVSGTDAEPLIAAQNRLWGVSHSDVGKQIQHRGIIVTVLSVHQNIRLVVPVGQESYR